MIAAQPAERPIESRRLVTAHVHTAASQAVPESARCLPESTHPVVQKPDLYALARLLQQRVSKRAALVIFVNDVHLEVNRLSCGMDRVQPGRVVLGGIFEKRDSIAVA